MYFDRLSINFDRLSINFDGLSINFDELSIDFGVIKTNSPTLAGLFTLSISYALLFKRSFLLVVLYVAVEGAGVTAARTCSWIAFCYHVCGLQPDCLDCGSLIIFLIHSVD